MLATRQRPAAESLPTRGLRPRRGARARARVPRRQRTRPVDARFGEMTLRAETVERSADASEPAESAHLARPGAHRKALARREGKKLFGGVGFEQLRHPGLAGLAGRGDANRAGDLGVGLSQNFLERLFDRALDLLLPARHQLERAGF